MHHIVYTSTAVQPITETDLEEILTSCREHNQQSQVTGLLLYSEEASGFIQVLEGEKETLRRIYLRIERDCRHRNLTKLADGPSQNRNFSSWLMAFKRVNSSTFAQLAGYIDPQSPEFARIMTNTSDDLIRQLMEVFALEEPAKVY